MPITLHFSGVCATNFVARTLGNRIAGASRFLGYLLRRKAWGGSESASCLTCKNFCVSYQALGANELSFLLLNAKHESNLHGLEHRNPLKRQWVG
jgi:hypothetical protein